MNILNFIKKIKNNTRMKGIKRFSVFLLVIYILTFTGCALVQEQKEFLYYQNYSSEVRLTLKNEADLYSLNISLGEVSSGDIPAVTEFGRINAVITVLSPESISGVQYIFDPSGAYIVSGDVKIPVNPSVVSGLLPLLRCFYIDPESVIQMDTDASGDVPLTIAEFRTDDGKVTLYLNDEGLPVRIILDGGVILTAEIEEYIISDSSEN